MSILTLFSLLPLAAGELKVAVLHPLLGDLARQVGGVQVEVIDLIGAKGDPHHFEPKPEDLKKAEGAAIYLVAGMGLEGYLPKLRAIIGTKAALIEVATAEPILRGKGFIRTAESEPGYLVQAVRARVAISVDTAKPDAQQSELVFIGYHLSRHKVAARLSELTETQWK